MKKTIVLFVVIIMMMFSLVACGNETSSITCPNCKTEVINDSSFCSNCGANLNSGEMKTNETTFSNTEITQPSNDVSVTNTTTTESVITTTQHTHQYSTKKVSQTCELDGFTQYICVCGYSYNDNYINASGHDWKAATCTAAKTCQTCGKTSGEPLVHNYVSGVCTYCNCYDYLYVELARDAYEYMNTKYGLTTYDVVTITGGEIDGKPAVKFYYGYIKYFTYNDVTGRVTAWSVGNVEFTEYFKMDVKSVLDE